ncbi:MAG: nucleoside-diphosphate-sugar epimerase [Polyangiales bacterium]|jgi:nucleoside-diphosphate-sugar epimerase
MLFVSTQVIVRKSRIYPVHSRPVLEAPRENIVLNTDRDGAVHGGEVPEGVPPSPSIVDDDVELSDHFLDIVGDHKMGRVSSSDMNESSPSDAGTSMRVFITGGSGFVGGHLIERLVADGHDVYAMARSKRSEAVVAGFGATPVRCALGDVRVHHLGDADVIIHCAAFVEEWGTREEFVRVNVEGTKQLLAMAQQVGTPRFIHISTEAVLFNGEDLVDIDETTPYPAQTFLYSETKAEAERRVLAANGPGLCTISLRPRFVWGPRDQTILPAIARMAKRWTWIDGGRAQTSTTHVANLAHAVSLALHRGRGGEAYFVADRERSTLRGFLTSLARTRDVMLPSRSLPRPFVRALAEVLERAYRLASSKSPPPITRFSASMMSSTVTVRTAKAERELGYAPVISVAEGLAEL